MLCYDCPRHCGARREPLSGEGFCKMGTLPVLARAGLHHWEEPCISGTRGSGTVFFSGCPLHCVYCQNQRIGAEGFGKAVSVERLREIYQELIAQGAHNINLVTPTHFTDAILASLPSPLPVPVVYNCGGYEEVGTLRRLEGKIQVYMPDLKYLDSELSRRYSHAPDYPEAAKRAIQEMYRQTGPYQLDGDGMLLRGVLIRHLVLPGLIENTLDVIDWVIDSFPKGSVLFSLMGQYLPYAGAADYPELSRPITPQEYRRCQEYLLTAGFEDGYFQELSASSEAYIPDFNLEGV